MKKKPVILVVDDDPVVSNMIKSMLARQGMDTILAGTATQAAQVLRVQSLPDLMILDLILPDINGIEFLKQLRGKAMFAELPILILSAVVDPDEIRTGLSAGADRYITKPYLATNLIPTVQQLLQSGRIRK